MENNNVEQPIVQPIQPEQPAQFAQPEQPKKGSKAGLYVIIAVLATAVVGLAVALVIVLLNSNNSSKTVSKEQPEEQQEEQPEERKVSLAVRKRDEQRKDDIARFLTAANDFQTNNYGKTPWQSGMVNIKFVNRYIDSGCTMIGGYGETYKCDDDAKLFRDPDGTVYSFKLLEKIQMMTDIGTELSVKGDIKAWPNDHKVAVIPSFKCGDKEGFVDYVANSSIYAMLYRLESGEITCNDNN